MAIITPALGAARSSLNKRFPSRDKASDGWIGNEAHKGTRSGHNPDETGNAEYTDSDNIDEVRAVDLDADLKEPGTTMQDVVDSILATPKDRDRCSYIIYNRRIWSRSANYVPRTYTGSNDHSKHGHISGRPQNDNDGSPWLSIENLGGDMATAKEVWETDGIVESPLCNPGGTRRTVEQLKAEPHWKAETVLRGSYDNAARATLEAKTQGEKVLAKLDTLSLPTKEEALQALEAGAYNAIRDALKP